MKKRGRVVANGITFEGKKVSINDTEVHVDGVKQDNIIDGHIKVIVHGDVESIATNDGDVEAEDVANVTTDSGDVKCGDIAGNVTTRSGDVKCGDVEGNVTTTKGDIIQK